MAALMVLALASGCASVKYTVREASGALNAIATLSQTGDEEIPEQIYSAEEQILDACGTLLDSAFIVSVGDHLPLLSWVEVLYSSRNCRQVVASVRRELEATQLLTSDQDNPGRDLAMNMQ